MNVATNTVFHELRSIIKKLDYEHIFGILPEIHEILNDFVEKATDKRLRLKFVFESSTSDTEFEDNAVFMFVHHLCTEQGQSFRLEENKENYSDQGSTKAVKRKKISSIDTKVKQRERNDKKKVASNHVSSKSASADPEMCLGDDDANICSLPAELRLHVGDPGATDISESHIAPKKVIQRKATPIYSCRSKRKRKMSKKFADTLKETSSTDESVKDDLEAEDKVELKCHQCAFKTHFKYSLQRHIMSKHPTAGDEKHSCKVCFSTLLTADALEAHIAKHHSQGNPTCSICGKHYTNKAALSVHIKLKHDKIAPKYKCPICEKAFHQKHHYDGHMDTHEGIKRHLCKGCGASFSYISSLNKHKCKEKKDQAPFPCEQCGLVFAKKAYLREHLVGKHSDKMPYTCEHCAKGFPWRGSWANHQNFCKEKKAKELAFDDANSNLTECSKDTENIIESNSMSIFTLSLNSSNL